MSSEILKAVANKWQTIKKTPVTSDKRLFNHVL